MWRFIDRDIAVERALGDRIETLEGTLLSTQGGIVIREADGSTSSLPHNAGVNPSSLPGGWITRPTLVWDGPRNRPESTGTRVAYQTGGITWWADYNLTFSEGGDANSWKLDVAWVSILNQIRCQHTRAQRSSWSPGDVHRAAFTWGQAVPMAAKRGRRTWRKKAPASEARSSSITFTRWDAPVRFRTTQPNRSNCFKVADVACDKTLVYYGQAGQWYGGGPMTDRNYGITGNKKVDTYLSFRNKSRTDGRCRRLPASAGRQARHGGRQPEFISEDRIDHTPRNETVC